MQTFWQSSDVIRDHRSVHIKANSVEHKCTATNERGFPSEIDLTEVWLRNIWCFSKRDIFHADINTHPVLLYTHRYFLSTLSSLCCLS
jgi:hypothetical protein